MLAGVYAVLGRIESSYHCNNLDDGERTFSPAPPCHVDERLGSKWPDESGDDL